LVSVLIGIVGTAGPAIGNIHLANFLVNGRGLVGRLVVATLLSEGFVLRPYQIIRGGVNQGSQCRGNIRLGGEKIVFLKEIAC
jgi:hypothetical protein